MATGNRDSKSKIYDSNDIISGNKKIWFLNNDLVRLHHSSRSSNIVSIFNITKNQFESCLRSDFMKNRKRAYTVAETSRLVNKHRKYFPSLIKRGIIPPPIGAQENGIRGWQVRSYYSELQVKEIRDILATIHRGRPRKDNLITNNSVPNPQELTQKMGDGILVYTKTKDGRFIPIWGESIN
jgi:hypothetical protein